MSRNRKNKAIPKRRNPAKRRRTAVYREGDKRTVIRQDNTKGYDVEMIRDFLDHLLLELRVQHFENLQSLRCLEGISEFAEATAAAGEVSPTLVEEFTKYHLKYQTALLLADAIDNSGATDDETCDVAVTVLKAQAKLRDEQIGHLEALQELFEEALMCAKVPFGVSADGNAAQPIRTWSVRELLDDFDDTPDFDELVSKYEGHPLTTSEVIESLKAAEIILAVNRSFEAPRILFGRTELETIANGESAEQRKTLTIRVDSPEELQFAVATVAKHKGRHDYGGNYDDEF